MFTKVAIKALVNKLSFKKARYGKFRDSGFTTEILIELFEGQS